MKTEVTLAWKKMNVKAEIPAAATAGAACFDLKAALDADITLQPGVITAVPTGLAVEIPQGFEMQVRARSGLAFKHGFALVNGVGTIDSDYRGEIKVISTILGKEPLVIKNGDRIAQALVAEVIPVRHIDVAVTGGDLSSTQRGAGGFGSSGVSGNSTYTNAE
jgi:dUTP pyrophosphatase